MSYKARYNVGSHFGPGQKIDKAAKAESISLREKLYGESTFAIAEKISYITPIISVFLICYFSYK